MTKKDQIKKELEEIEKADPAGVIRPAAVVEYAQKNQKSELHGHFEWDDSVAGSAYRLQQARALIRIHWTVVTGVTEKVPLWVSTPTRRKEPGGGYERITTVMTDEETRALMLAEAKSWLESFRRRYGTMEELAAVFAAVDKMAS